MFVEELDLAALGFDGSVPADTGRPAYHPGAAQTLYLWVSELDCFKPAAERESQRNVELVWLLGRLMPDFKTIADFRKDNGAAIRRVYTEFVLLCRRLALFSDARVAIDGSKFKAVNNRDRNFTRHKLAERLKQLEQGVGHYLEALDRADREPERVPPGRVAHLREKLAAAREQTRQFVPSAASWSAGRITRSRSPIRMRIPWRPVDGEPAWWVITCRPQ